MSKKEMHQILSNLETVRNEIIPDYLEYEVESYKQHAPHSSSLTYADKPAEYLANCIMNWVIAAIKNPDMVY